MVGHEVDNDLHTCFVSALDELFELLHALIHICGEVGIDIIVVSNGIWRSCPALHDGWMILRDAIGRIVGLSGMTDDTRVPNMAHAHFPDFFQGTGREVVQFSTSVFLNRTMFLAGRVTIAVETGEDLIDNYLIRFHVRTLLC